MRFTIKKENMLPLLARVNNIIEKKSTQKVRTNVLINTKDDSIELIGFDNEIKISGFVPAKIEESGSITVSSQKLFDIIRTIPSDSDVEIQCLDNSLHIITGKNKFQLATIPADDFPLPDNYSFDKQVKLPADTFVKLINKVKFSMAVNDVRAYLNGLLLDFKKTELVAVSTDGHRLSAASIENKYGLEDTKIILPRKAVTEISKWLQAEQGELTIDTSETHIKFSYSGTEIVSSVINAKYPAYEAVIPELSENKVVISTQVLKSALTRAKILSSEHGVGVSLVFSPWELELSAKNMDNEKVEDKVDINYDGEKIKIAFNINYLIELLDVIACENITMSLKDGNSSCLVYNAETEDAQYIIMPMNI